jgi:A/G-specific adenine glycosylase
MEKIMQSINEMAIRQKLLTWYDQGHRLLPWRASKNPWEIWVSEIMLQQTRVVSVLSYFPKFIQRFPTPLALAQSNEEDLSQYWAGLGYYARARNLLAASRTIVDQHQGEIPKDPEVFAQLKGVGPYTKGAVMSIAFDLEVPIVDGNVMRVLSRVYCIEDEISQAKNQQQFWQIATRLVKGIRPGDFNQSLMELGAMVCTPKSPTCLLCPLKDECQAFQNQKVHILPKKASKAKIEDFHYVALVVKDQNQVLVGLRAHQGLLGGMWCLPMFESDLILNALPKEKLLKHGQIQHAFTHKRWVLDLYEIPKTALQDEQLILNSDQNQRMKWGYFDEQTLDTMAISGPSLKALLKAKMKLTKRRGAGH